MIFYKPSSKDVCLGTTEFFINKAIGCALREYSKVNKDGFLSFVDAYHEKLSNLSMREALKWLRSKDLV
ncbi:DNA alkylation repair protein [Bacillus sp. DJP31]|uniref:DNA alkylation repair protein n=1 Tax=Bacillus sp. DJP31 TaxID=3409789 RepID=UPI003BB7EA41